MDDTYKTITKQSESIYTEKRSKFIAIAIPVQTIEEVKAQLDCYQKKYYDARHVCYAYMLGAERKNFRANDNGEPSGTAGKPILGQINSFELTDILVIVVRYFGGIKLGTSGLIVAYRTATSQALSAAEIIEKINPRIAIPMHYRNDEKGFGFDVLSTLEPFVKCLKHVSYLDGSSIDTDVVSESGVIVLSPKALRNS